MMLKKIMFRTISICLIICLMLNTCQAALYAAPQDPQQQLFEEILNQATDPVLEEEPANTEVEETEAEKAAAKEKAILDYKARFNEPEPEYQSNRFIIKYKSGKKDSAKQTVERSLGAKFNKGQTKQSVQSQTEIMETTEGMNFSEFKEKLQEAGVLDNIEYIQPDYVMDMSSFNDPLLLLGQQWGHAQNYQPPAPNPEEQEEPSILERIFSKSSAPASYQMDANVTEAWADSQGEGVLVAILDTGIDTSHPDLKDRTYKNPGETNNGQDDDNNGYIDDVSGWDFFNKTNQVNDPDNIYDKWHGTHIAGIIAATGNNGQGIAGVAPQAKILPLKVFQGGVAYTSDIIEAIAYAEAQGAKIANCSWGSRYDNPALEEAIANSNMLFVCATGNSLYNLDDYPVYPASLSKTLDNVISVASIDQDGRLSRYSNYGPNSVNLAAPGRDIISTWINGEYTTTSGTSMAAAYVSGAAALVAAQDLQKTSGVIKQRLIDAGDKVTGLTDKISGGKKLNCAYAVSAKVKPNPNVIKVEDTAITPVVPGEPPAESPELFGAENYISIKADMPTARYGLAVVAVTKDSLNRDQNLVYTIGGQGISGYSSKVEAYNPQTDTWSTKADLPTARSYFGCAQVNGKIYVMGGYNGGYLNSVYMYDTATNNWTEKYNLPVAMSAFTATAVGDKIYVIGGKTGTSASAIRNSVYVYDTVNNTWDTTRPNISTPKAYHTAFYYNGNIHVECGMGSGIPRKNTEEIYNIATGTTTPGGQSRVFMVDAAAVVTQDRFIGIGGCDTIYSGLYTTHIMQESLLESSTYYHSGIHMQRARAGLGAALLNGKVYIAGGYNNNGIFSVLEVMDLGWEDKGQLPIAANNFKTATLDGKLYMMGGESLVNGQTQRINHLYAYDPNSSTWERKYDMPFYGNGYAVASSYGKIYIFGGQTSSTATGALAASNKVYAYDPGTNSWVEKAVLRSNRSNADAILYNGKIYVTGGGNYVDAYDPLSNTWQAKNNLPGSISGHYSLIANDTLFLITSGTAVYKYNLATDSWQTQTSMGGGLNSIRFIIAEILYTISSSNNIAPAVYQYFGAENTWTYYKTFNFFNVKKSL